MTGQCAGLGGGKQGNRKWKIEKRLTSQEAVQLHQQLKVDIVTLRRLAVGVADVMSVEIDT